MAQKTEIKQSQIICPIKSSGVEKLHNYLIFFYKKKHPFFFCLVSCGHILFQTHGQGRVTLMCLNICHSMYIAWRMSSLVTFLDRQQICCKYPRLKEDQQLFPCLHLPSNIYWSRPPYSQEVCTKKPQMYRVEAPFVPEILISFGHFTVY